MALAFGVNCPMIRCSKCGKLDGWDKSIAWSCDCCDGDKVSLVPLLEQYDPESGLLSYVGHFDFLQCQALDDWWTVECIYNVPLDTAYQTDDEALAQYLDNFRKTPPDGFLDGDPIEWAEANPDEEESVYILDRIQHLRAKSFLQQHVRKGTAFREETILRWLFDYRSTSVPFDHFWPAPLESARHALSSLVAAPRPFSLLCCARDQNGRSSLVFAVSRKNETLHRCVDAQVVNKTSDNQRCKLLRDLSGELFIDPKRIKQLDKEFKTALSNYESVPQDCCIVRAPCVIENVLVLNNCLIQNGRSVSWSSAKILVEGETASFHQTPTVRLHEPIDLTGANVHRNRFLSNVWKVHGPDACLLMVFMMSRLVSNMFQSAGQHEHQPAAWLLVGPTQTFKSTLMRAFAQAVGCSNNLVGEAHSPNLGKDELSKLALVFDDIGKTQASKANFGIDHLKKLIGVSANQTGVLSKGKHVDSSALIMATFNHDNFAKLLERDDAEQTLLSRCVTVSWKSCPAVRGSGHVKALSPHEGDMLVASLASLTFDSQSYRSCEQVLEMTCGLTGDSMRRKKNLLACDMMYAIQIWADFLKQSCLAGFPQEEVTLFVKEHMAPSTVKELVSVPQSQVLEDSNVIILKQFVHTQIALLPPKPDGCISSPVCMRWDDELGKVVPWPTGSSYLKTFRRLGIVTHEKWTKERINHDEAWPSKRPQLYRIKLACLGLEEKK